MKAGTDLMAGQSPLFSYPRSRRRRWTYRYRLPLIGAGLLVGSAVGVLAVARMWPW